MSTIFESQTVHSYLLSKNLSKIIDMGHFFKYTMKKEGPK